MARKRMNGSADLDRRVNRAEKERRSEGKKAGKKRKPGKLSIPPRKK